MSITTVLAQIRHIVSFSTFFLEKGRYYLDHLSENQQELFNLLVSSDLVFSWLCFFQVLIQNKKIDLSHVTSKCGSLDNIHHRPGNNKPGNVQGEFKRNIGYRGTCHQQISNPHFFPQTTSFTGCCLAQLVKHAPHVPRLCSGPGLLRVTPPLSLPVSCHIFGWPISKSHKRPKKYFKKTKQKLHHSPLRCLAQSTSKTNQSIFQENHFQRYMYSC